MIGLGIGVWLRSEQLGEAATVLPSRSVSILQTISDFNQVFTATVTDPEDFSPSMDFSDARNSQYLSLGF